MANRTRSSARTVHLARVEAAAAYLCEEMDRPWSDAEEEKRNAWRWIAEQALDAATTAAGRTKSRTR